MQIFEFIKRNKDFNKQHDYIENYEYNVISAEKYTTIIFGRR